MKLGERIRAERTARGMSQEQVARAADVSLNLVGRIERSETPDPHYSTLDRLARALGVSVSDLVGEREAPKASAPTSPVQAEEEGRRSQGLVEMTQAEFLREVAAAASESYEALRKLYSRADAERTELELIWREDEGNQKARQDYALAVQRRMILHLSLYQRGIAPRDPEDADLEELAKVLESG